MQARPYKYPVANFQRMHWAALHDERLTLNLMDPDVPKEFVEDVRRVHEEQQWVSTESGDTSWTYAKENVLIGRTCAPCFVFRALGVILVYR